MSTYIIYKTINLLDGKYYIGQHKQETLEFDGYLGSGLRLNNSILKYGKQNFIRETLEVCNENNINEKEIFWIKDLSATNRDLGYNLSFGGTGGCHFEMTKEIKNKISKNHADFSGKNHPLYGIGHTEETKEKIRKLALGRKINDKTKIKLTKYIYNAIDRQGKTYYNILLIGDFCKNHGLLFKQLNGNFRTKEQLKTTYHGWVFERRLKNE